jgi:hypothetical protein
MISERTISAGLGLRRGSLKIIQQDLCEFEDCRLQVDILKSNINNPTGQSDRQHKQTAAPCDLKQNIESDPN